MNKTFWKYGFEFLRQKTKKGYKLYSIVNSNKQFLGWRKSLKDTNKLIKEVVFKTTFG